MPRFGANKCISKWNSKIDVPPSLSLSLFLFLSPSLPLSPLNDPIGWAPRGDSVELYFHFSLLLIHLPFPLFSREWFPSYLLALERISAMLRLCWNIISPTYRYQARNLREESSESSKGAKTAGGSS